MGITNLIHSKGVIALFTNSFTRTFIFVIIGCLIGAFVFIFISNTYVRIKKHSKVKARLSISDIQKLALDKESKKEVNK